MEKPIKKDKIGKDKTIVVDSLISPWWLLLKTNQN